MVGVKTNFTKYCRLPGSEWLSYGCYFSYGSEKFFKGMLWVGKGQFIHRLSTRERIQNSEFRRRKGEYTRGRSTYRDEWIETKKKPAQPNGRYAGLRRLQCRSDRLAATDRRCSGHCCCSRNSRCRG